jgi:hypothetical protein
MLVTRRTQRVHLPVRPIRAACFQRCPTQKAALAGGAREVRRALESATIEGKKAMNAAVLHASGEIPCFERFAEPVAGGDEAMVHVRAAALKPIDK